MNVSMRDQIAILHYAAPPIIGGVEITIYYHALLLAEAGYRVKVIAGRGEAFHPEVTFQLIPEINSRHPETLAVGQSLAGGHVSPEFTSLRDGLIDRLRPELTQVGVCLVHNALSLHKNLPLTAALRHLSDEGVTSLIAWNHDFAWLDHLYTPSLHPGYPWDLLRTPWPGVRYVVVSSARRARLAELLAIPQESIAVVTPGVDVERLLKLEPLTQDLVEKLDLLEADPLMLLPARVTRRKNIQFAIRVTAALQKQKPKVVLVITGPPGPHNPKNLAYLASLKTLSKELGIAHKVHFLYEYGECKKPLIVPDEVIADLYKISDLLLFPSHREGFGIPILEAGLVRLPIFAADIPSIHESAGDMAEFFDPEGNPHQVAESIISQLASNPYYHLRRRVLDHFTWKSIVKNKVVPLIMESVNPHGFRE